MNTSFRGTSETPTVPSTPRRSGGLLSRATLRSLAALAAMTLAPDLAAEQVWVPLTPGVPPGTPAEIVYDVQASNAVDSIFDIHVHGFWQEQVEPFEGETYQRLEFPGLGLINQEGAPDLPVARLELAVGTDASLVSLASLIELDAQVFDLRPCPVGTEELEGGDTGFVPSQFVRDEAIYGGGASFPATSATSALIPAIRMSSIPAVEHEVYPARWDPTTNQLSVSSHLRVHYAAPGMPVEQPAMTKDRASLAAATFPNWPNQKAFFPPDTVEYAGRYLIVAKQYDLWAMTDFIDFKKAQGFSVDTLRLDDLPMVTVGSVRAAMADWYELGDPTDDHYALLVGDDHEIPVGLQLVTKPARTDDFYGSPVDGNLDEEIYVGRISAPHVTNLRQQLQMIMDYAQDQQGDHYDQALLVAATGENLRYVHNQDEVAAGLYASAPDFQKIYGNNLVAQSFHIIDAIDDGKGVVAYRGHGSKWNWWHWNAYLEDFDRPDVTSLANADEPSVVWSITCYANEFDGHEDHDSVGETWMQHDGGAVAHYGSVEMSNTHENDLLVKYLFKAVYDHHITRHGQAIAWAEAQMHKDRPGMNSWRYMLFGDPSMRIRTSNPIDLTPDLPDSFAADQGPDGTLEMAVVDGQGLPLEGLLVSAYQPGEQGFQINGYTDADGMVQLAADADAWSGPVQVVVADALGNQVGAEVPVTIGAWTDLGGASTGSFGMPLLTAEGSLAANAPYGLAVSDAHPSSPALLAVSLSSLPVPFKGVTLQAFPITAQFALSTNAVGGLVLGGTWPAGVPAGTEFWLQTLVADPGLPGGVSITNAVKGTTP